MQSIHNYDVYIFDCDGVILDSNKLKIDAMEKALLVLNIESASIENCLDYFARNFGKSRFHHVDVFLDEFLRIEDNRRGNMKKRILELFSEQCKSLYLKADITPGFEGFIQSLKGRCYVASGSEQKELREVFKTRRLDSYFVGIFGSPTKKTQLVESILLKESTQKVIMFGDALSDLEAAQTSGIDFVAYTPFSNVPEELVKQARSLSQRIINDWSNLK